MSSSGVNECSLQAANHSQAANDASQSVAILEIPKSDGSNPATHTEKAGNPARRSNDDVRISVEDVPVIQGGGNTIPTTDDYRVPGFPLEGPCLSMKKDRGKDSDYWGQLLAAVEKHDNDLCTTWREDIDTLLVFTGLFTAIVTAFTIESYQWLQPEPADVTNVLLLGLSRQLADSNLPPLSDPTTEFMAPPYAIRINSLWFLSITLSLAAGLIGLLCKQWMREFQRDASLPAKDALALRQLRWLGWERWGVPQITSLPALLLQASLFLFLAGLLDLLWSKVQSHIVAVIATAVVGLVAFGMILTTCLPLMSFLSRKNLKRDSGMYDVELAPSSPCPSRSPQSYLLLKFWDLLAKFVFSVKPLQRWACPVFGSWLQMERTVLGRNFWGCGGRNELHESISMYRSLGLRWVKDTLAFNRKIRVALSHCISENQTRCARDNGRCHFGTPTTQRECMEDSPHNIFDSVLTPSDGALQVELLLRAVSVRPFEDVPTPLWDKLFSTVQWYATSELHTVVSQQLLRYAGFRLQYPSPTSDPQSIWHVILSICLGDERHSDILVDILQKYGESLQHSPDKRSTALVKALFWYWDGGPPNRLSQRAGFLPVMNALKYSRPYIDAHEQGPVAQSENAAMLYEILKVRFLNATSSEVLPRNFFEDERS